MSLSLLPLAVSGGLRLADRLLSQGRVGLAPPLVLNYSFGAAMASAVGAARDRDIFPLPTLGVDNFDVNACGSVW